MKKVGVCIVFYDDMAHISRLVAALKKQTCTDFAVLFTDNKEDHPHLPVFSSLMPEALYIESPGNTGFAGGNNMLATKAKEMGCGFVWILNPDMEPAPDCLEKMLAVMDKNENHCALGPVVCTGNSHSSPMVQVAGEQVNFYSQKKINQYAGTFASTLPSCEWFYADSINGGSLLLRTSLIDDTGVFEESYFMYNDEIDLMYRLAKKGCRVGVVRYAICFHHHDWSRKNKKGYYVMYYYMMRNKVLYWKKFGMYPRLLRGALIQLFLFPVTVAFCIRTAGLSLVYYYYLGWLHGFYGKKGKASLDFA